LKRNIKILIQYDGTSFSGWQRQNNATTIQQTIEEKLSQFMREEIIIVGSGRTDAGVHALEQVAHFKTNSHFDVETILYKANALLPKTIRVMECKEVAHDFHARFSATKREYKYVIYNDLVCPPFKRDFATHIKKTLDVNKLNDSLQLLVGEHDFTSFCSASDESESKIRTIFDIELIQDEKEIIIYLRANAFLRKMIRMIMGTVLEINLKNRPIEEISQLFESKSRDGSYTTAPAEGLFLSRVWYP